MSKLSKLLLVASVALSANTFAADFEDKSQDMQKPDAQQMQQMPERQGTRGDNRNVQRPDVDIRQNGQRNMEAPGNPKQSM